MELLLEQIMVFCVFGVMHQLVINVHVELLVMRERALCQALFISFYIVFYLFIPSVILLIILVLNFRNKILNKYSLC